MSKFNIGDEVWYASTEYQEKWITCPDCLGHKYLRVIFGDDTEVSIDCANCAPGYDPPRGVIKLGTYEVAVRQVTIGGMELQKDKEPEYKFDCYSGGCCRTKESQLFAAKEEAENVGRVLAAQMTKDEADRVNKKEKDTRTWAWNATYHRRMIKDAERNLKYHTDKLAAALRHQKAEKSETL